MGLVSYNGEVLNKGQVIGKFRADNKIINEEILNKFERDLLTTENIWDSIEYTTIPQKDLKRWYLIKLNNYKKNEINESFVIFNRLLIIDYLSLKREGIKDSDIERQLNISKEMLELITLEPSEEISNTFCLSVYAASFLTTAPSISSISR